MRYYHQKNNNEKDTNDILKIIILALTAFILLILAGTLAVHLARILTGEERIQETVAEVEVVKASHTPAPTLRPIASPEPSPSAEPTPEPQPVRRGTAEPIPQEVRTQMAGKSMPAGARVGYDELSYLTIPHYDFDYNVTEGHLIVNKAVAEEVLDIFAELYDIKYPIERMEIVDKYNASDYDSIDNNNTSAFNYRESTDGSGRLSNHAYGRAIDINPQINPYVASNGRGSHPNAAEYWSRNKDAWTSDVAKAAYIGTDAQIYKIFTKYGWTWGGHWSSYRDYQHFEKRG